MRAPNWVGDAVMSFPFFASLKASAPSAEVLCLCRPFLGGLFRTVAGVDQVIVLNESKGRSGLGFIWRNAGYLRRMGIDMGFALPSSFGSALMLRLAHIPIRVGYSAEARGPLLTHSIPYGANGQRPHRTEGYLKLLGLPFPAPTFDRTLRYTPDPVSTNAAADLRERNASLIVPVLAMAPNAAQQNKMWDASRFAIIGRQWIDEFKGSVILVGAAGDYEACEALRSSIDPGSVVNFAGAGDLPLTAALMAQCDAFLGNDSGLAHLAAAVGLPSVVVSGPGDPTEVAPFSPLAITVKRQLFCSPCYKNYCYRKDSPLECLTAIPPEDVWQHLSRFGKKVQGA